MARKKGFSIREVTVTLATITGAPIESGAAIKNKDGNWVYRNTVPVQDADSVTLLVRAVDVDGRVVW